MALWFGLVMAAPAILHSCPQALASQAAAAEAEVGHPAHSAHHSDHQETKGPADCRCLGSCAIATAASLPAGTTVAVVVPTPSAPRAPLVAVDVAVRLTPDHSQPLATAPPRSIS